ncbi:MAG: helix-turn-helix transcriptional regulator [Akkermansiaceae bacterium]|nr:helix-turn-helix transcriptional regulator [Akkermansiaceae bacterium]
MPSEEADAFLKALVEELKEIRAAAGVSQEQLATQSGVDRAIISRLERLERIPSIMALYDLARALKVPFHLIAEKAEQRKP